MKIAVFCFITIGDKDLAKRSIVLSCLILLFSSIASANQPPTAIIDHVTPNPAAIGQEVNFKGHGADPDGTIVGYEWYTLQKGIISDQASFLNTTLPPGNYLISFRVKDNNDVWSSPTYFNFIRASNNPPLAIIDSITPSYSLIPGVPITFSGHGIDTDGYVVAYQWFSGTDGPLSTEATFTTSSLSEGVHAITLVVKDDKGAWSRMASSEVAIGSHPPFAVINAVAPNPAVVGRPITFNGYGMSYSGSTIVGYSWRSSIDGPLSAAKDFTSDKLSVGVHTIYFKVNDSNGSWSPEVTASLTVNITDAIPPSEPSEIRDGADKWDIDYSTSSNTLYANWDPTDISPLLVKYWYAIGTSPYDTDVRDWTDNGNSTVAKYEGNLINGQTYYVSVYVQDWYNQLESSYSICSDGVTIDQAPPPKIIKVRDGTNVNADIDYTTSTAEISANWDAVIDGETEVAKYWYAIGTYPGGSNVVKWTDNGLSTSVTKKGAPLLLGKTYYFSVYAEDIAGNQGYSTITSSDGQKIDVDSLKAIIDSITQTSFSYREPVTFVGHGESMSSSIVEYSWYSSLDGFLSAEPTFTTSYLSVGTHTIFFGVKDNLGNWSSEATRTLSIGNQPPAVSIDSITPNPAIQGQPVTFTGSGTDVDGTILVYEWYSLEDGLLSTESTFTTATLAPGAHMISFRALDDNFEWSEEKWIRLAIVSGSSGQILQNPSFESGYRSWFGQQIDHWISDNVSVIWATDRTLSDSWYNGVVYRSGRYGLFSVIGNGGVVWQEGATYQEFNSMPGKIYNASVWIKLPSNSMNIYQIPLNNVPADSLAYLKLEFLDSSKNSIGSVEGTPLIKLDDPGYVEVWTECKITGAVAPLETAYVRVELVVKRAPQSWELDGRAEASFDDAFLEEFTGAAAPTAIIDSIPPRFAKKGQSITFSGYGVDPGGAIVGYNWRSSIDGFLSAEPTFTTSNLSAGTHTIYFKVQNDGENWSSEVREVLTIDNTPPTAVIDYIMPIPAIQGQPITFKGHGIDAEGTITAYVWKQRYGYNLLSAEPTFTTSNLSAGIHTIYFSVKDNSGTWSSPATFTLEVFSSDWTLFAVINSITPNPAREGQSVTFNGYGMVRNGAKIDYLPETGTYIKHYIWRDGLVELSRSESFTTSFLKPGTHWITFEVIDRWGYPRQRSSPFPLVVAPNEAPTATIDSVTPNSTKRGRPITFSGSGTDTDGTIAGYIWYFPDGSFGFDSIVTTAGMPVGAHTVYFQVKDNDGKWSPKVPINFTVVANPDFKATITSVTPNPTKVGQPVTFSGTGIDPDGTIVGYNWRSSIDGNLSAQASFTTSSLSPGNHTIYFKVQNDAGGWSDEATTNVTVTKPIADTNLLVNGSFETGDFTGWGPWMTSSGWSVVATNPQNGSFHVRAYAKWGWLQRVNVIGGRNYRLTAWIYAPDGGFEYYPAVWGAGMQIEFFDSSNRYLGAYSASAKNPRNQYNMADTGWVSAPTAATYAKVWFMISHWPDAIPAYPIDFDNFVLLEANNQPAASITSLTPNPTTLGQAVTFTGAGTDVDGAIVGYNWRSSIDGNLSTQASFTTSSLSVGTHTIYFKVRDDLGDWSTEATSTLTITNNLPIAIIDSVAPLTIIQGQPISFTGHGTDVDGTIVGYNWRSSLDGYLNNQASFTTSSLSIGTHTIWFKVKDSLGDWSDEVTISLTVKKPLIEAKVLVNPSFETGDFTGWEPLTTTANWSAVQTNPQDGSFHARIYSGDGGWNQQVYVTGGRKYRLTALVYTPSGGSEYDTTAWNGWIKIYFYDIYNRILRVYSASAKDPRNQYNMADTGWVPAPMTARYAKIYFMISKLPDAIPAYPIDFDNFVLLEANNQPAASITSLTPNPITLGQAVTFTGAGTDVDGAIVGYNWRSSIDGNLSAQASFTTSSLSVGTHTIYFKVQDNSLEWSDEITSSLTITFKPTAKIPGSPDRYFSAIQEAYNAAVEGETIQCQAGDFVENLNIDAAKSVKFEGGYDISFTTIIGTSRVSSINVANGALTAGNFTIY